MKSKQLGGEAMTSASLNELTPYFDPYHESFPDLVAEIVKRRDEIGKSFSCLRITWDEEDEAHYGLLVNLETTPLSQEERDWVEAKPENVFDTSRFGVIVSIGTLPNVIDDIDDDPFTLLRDTAILYQKELKKYFPVVKRNMSRA